jgi:hypothetical protein
MKVLTTARGDIAYVDAVDADLAQYRWYLNRNGYFMRYICGGRAAQKQTTLHREILERVSSAPSPRHYVDHINCEKWDNRRSNLRWCTPHQSNWNKPAQGSNTGYRGVHRLKRYPKKYTASITIDGRCCYLGIFNSAEDAARVYDHALRKVGGSYARPNLRENIDG